MSGGSSGALLNAAGSAGILNGSSGAPAAAGATSGGGGVAGGAAGGPGAGSGGTDEGPATPGGESKCPLGGVELCDGFEGPAPGADSPFQFELASGSSGVVDTSKAYRGSKAVHLKTDGGQAFITETSTFTGTTAASNNGMWGRVFIWFETDAAPNSHDVFIRLEDPASKLESAQLHVAGGSRGQLAAEIRSGSDLYHPQIIDPRPAKAPEGTVIFPLETPKWQCWEWHTTPENTLEFFIDGELYAKMSVTAADKWPFPIFKKLYLGFMQYGTTPVTELWLDEVAISSTARVTCSK
jgi:hypothetical protein